ncbi:MAG TPA: hypothetical protein VK843_05450 [Planctomycetota bacterium]|nr:hypothetical protein [Planctomycetota bacterium]
MFLGLRPCPTSRRGSALISTLVVFVALFGLVYASSMTSVAESKDARTAMDDVRADLLASAGQERAMQFLANAVKNTSMHDPMQGLTNLFAGGTTITPFVGEPLMDGASQVGSYTVSINLVSSTPTTLTLGVDASGYLPDAPVDLSSGERIASWRASRTTLRYSLAPSKVFDYAYFINNWGWFYGNTILAKGNVRSNGQFDVAGYAPTVTGQPLYDSVAYSGGAATLSGYQDDDGNGLKDGNDGGVWSGWDITAAQNLKGNGGLAKNQHDFQAQVPMPNLSDLAAYETSAKVKNSSITIDGVKVCNAVLGDESGEKQNLYLVGTAAKPIVLNGPVVVRGSVIISGVVTGQGAIYSGGNVYCPQSVTYANPPTSVRPANNTQAATEAWLSTNWNKDFLGLFAKENVVVGNYTDSTWQSYVSGWMADSMNKSVEDAGLDGIQNTRKGRDGVLGTADDDLLEGDGVFTVERYTTNDETLGLIPAGKSVGDVIPGTGEDIDGDGVYDPGITLSSVAVPAALNTTNWGGNMPVAGVASYSSISSLYANQLDAVFYTNHSFCWVVLGGVSAKINGALVSRNENIVYGTPTVEINHDSRLLGSSASLAAGLLPREIQSAEVLRWVRLDQDPNRYVVHP